jgi:hypothetical protein
MSQDEQCTIDLTSKPQLRQFLEEERDEIERHKWIESEKAGRDLGYDAIMDWIRKYAKLYREEYISRKIKERINITD